MKLQTENPNCFVYETKELLIELLGGVRIDTLDRMRVTIKISVVNRKHKQYMNNEVIAGLAARHNLDLYNDVQVEKFIRRVAEKLEVGSVGLIKTIADITSQLEAYRLLSPHSVLTTPKTEVSAKSLEEDFAVLA